jgi:cold shock CspA family protein
MKVLFSLLWLLNFSPVQHGSSGEPATAVPAPATTEQTPPPQSANTPFYYTGTVVSFNEQTGMGRIKPSTSGNEIAVLATETSQRIEAGQQVSYTQSSDRRHGTRATGVKVIKP